MTRERWISIGSVAAALGGLSWLAKVAVIIATDGEVTDEGAAAFFYLLGVALMGIGSTAVGVLLAGRRSRWLVAVAVALSPIVYFVSYAVLDSITKPLVGDRGPAYAGDEVGILTTGLAWLMLGIGLLYTAHRSDGAEPIVRLRESSDSGTVVTP
jgi:hypothetical protein